MNKITTAVKGFVADENGVTAIEYGLIASLVGVGMVIAAGALGTTISDMFDYIGTKLKTSD